jgi:dihydroflavonol-4-reductase
MEVIEALDGIKAEIDHVAMPAVDYGHTRQYVAVGHHLEGGAMHVLVTGANGHLGTNLVPALLAAGHRVRAGVRSVDDATKTAGLRELGVELVSTQLSQPEQLRAAMTGVDVLCHCAAVYSYFEPGREQEILDVSVRGVETALRAAAAAKVRKVVLTSSAVTVPLTAPGAPPSTEEDWTSDLRVPYIRAKTEAERLAWKLARELGLSLVTVLPGSIGGPGFARNTPSIDTIEALMLNAFRMGCPDTNLPYVDARDVAAAHVMAIERQVQGRFIIVNDELPSFRRLLEVMHGIDPAVKLPLMTLPDAMTAVFPLFDWINSKTLGTPRIANADLIATLRGRRWNASNQRAKRLLQWQPRIALDDSLRETMAGIRRRRAQAAARPKVLRPT